MLNWSVQIYFHWLQHT